VFTASGTFINSGTVSGGGGGGGGGNANGPAGNYGGSGGVGGLGVLFSNGGSFTNSGNGKVYGGNGGNGGSALVGSDVPGDGSNGGGGGNGVQFTQGGTFTNAGAVTGGNGGNGGNAGETYAGNGGNGGTGVQFSSGGTFTNSGAVTGGNGGRSGSGSGGNGGNGGTGAQFSNGGTFTNSGSLTGGTGGANYLSIPGLGGAGGAGVSGANLAIVNSGTISGGLGAGGARADAIAFTGGINSLTLWASSTINGNVIAAGTSNTLALGGAANDGFDVAQIGPTAQYQGFGLFQMTGTGVWTLTGTNSGAMPWTVAAGTLAVNANIQNSTMTVNSGGTLAGTGIVGNTQVNAGGVFAPGSGAPGSSMTVNGSLTLASAVIYLVQINPATSSLANVTGTATLGGATVNAVYAAGSYIAKQYTILTAGSVSGTFGSLVNSNLPANFSASLSYDPGHAYLNLALNFTIPAGLNVNQRNVANTLTNFFNTTGGIPMAFGALTPAGLTQASGELATGSQQTTFDAMNLFMGVMTDPFAGGRGGAATPGAGAPAGYASTQNTGAARDAYAMFTKAAPVAPVEQRWSVWSAGFGGSQTTDGNAAVGSNSTTSNVYGTVVGADYRISPFTVAGFALAGGGTNFSVAGSGSGNSDLFQAGAFIRHTVGAAYRSPQRTRPSRRQILCPAGWYPDLARPSGLGA
jgi:hypothetical protein